MTAPILSAPQPLAERHQLADFDSSEPTLDDWLKRRAAKNQANGSSRTYVVCEGDTVIGVISIGDLVKAVIEDQKVELDHLQRYIAS